MGDGTTDLHPNIFNQVYKTSNVFNLQMINMASQNIENVVIPITNQISDSQPPIIVPVDDIQAYAGQSIDDIIFNITDSDTNNLSKHIELVSETANTILNHSFDNNTNTLTLTQNSTYLGVTNITLYVDDGTNSVQETFKVTMNASNAPPVIQTINNRTTVSGTNISDIDVVVSDSDIGDTIQVSISQEPSDIIIANYSDNKISIAQIGENIGVTNITVSATDGKQQTDITFTV